MANTDTNTFLNPNAIQDNAITSDKIKNLSGEKIEDLSIIGDKIIDGEISTDKIAGNAVTTIKINNSAVTTDKIAGGAVTTNKIADGNVTTDKIADSAVTTDKIEGEAVTTDELADNAVITKKIKDSAVTTDKIADSAVTNAKINDNAVTNVKIHDNAITTAKIVDNAITTVKIHDLDVTNDKIANKTITGSKIKNQTIWSNKLTWQTLSDASSDVDSSGILYTPVGPVETAAMFDNNVLSLGRPDGLLVEYTRNGGANWYEYYLSNYDKNYNDIKKVNMMTNGDPSSFAYFAGGRNYKVTNSNTGTLYASNNDTDPNRKMGTSGDALRFTFDAKGLGVYAQVVQIYAFISTNGSNITVNGSKVGRLKVKLETSPVNDPDNFKPAADNITVTGWSGWNAIPFNGARFGHPNYDNISNSTYVQKIRLTFTSEGAASEGNNWFQVYQFKFLATDAWGFPSELAKNKHVYKTEVTNIVDAKDAKGNDIRVPYTSMNTDGDIKANTIYEGNKKLSDKYVPYKDDGTSLVEGKLKSYVGYGYQNNTGAYSGLFISGAHINGTHGGQLNGSFDGGRLSFRGYNNGSFTDWKELAFKDEVTNTQTTLTSQINSLQTTLEGQINTKVSTLETNLNNKITSTQTSLEGQINTVSTKVSNVEFNFNTQITNLTNSTQKAVYDYNLLDPDNISDTTTSPTLLAKSNGLDISNKLAFFDTKFDGEQSGLSPRVQVGYGHDSDVIGFRRYKFDDVLNKWIWTNWQKVSFEGHTHTSNDTLNIHLKQNATGDGFEIVNGTYVNILKYASVIYDESSYTHIYLPTPKQQDVGAKITLIINNGQKGSSGINIRTGKYMSSGQETTGEFLIPDTSSNGNTIKYTESNIITLSSYLGTYLTTISFISNGSKWIVYYEK